MIARIGRVSAALFLGVSLTVGALGPAYAKDPVHFPKNPTGLTAPKRLPSTVDPVPGYFPQISCHPVEMQGVRKLRQLVLDTYGVGGYGGITRNCVYGGGSEHKEGRAWDWMVSVHNKKQRKAAGDFLSWLTEDGGLNARRLGVMYAIHNHKIWSSYRMGEGWRKYTGYDPHTSHIHLSFSWAGARGKTSFWTGKVGAVDYGSCRVFAGQPGVISTSTRRTPCASAVSSVKLSKRPTLYLGSTNRTQVRKAQQKLGISRTGVFDERTWRAVKRYQKSHELPRTGAVDDATWGSLNPAKVTKDVSDGYSPERAARYGKRHYGHTTLKRHSAGKAVLLLQTALRMPRSQRNGVYRKYTVRAVKRAQSGADLRRTGKVSKSLWKQLA
ncbi:MAG: peptidoglycan-binding domain-containing protein [Nocardioidaceae bacterium]